MHILLVTFGGFALLGVFLLFGYLWGEAGTTPLLAAWVFLPVWLVMALINLWVGVSRAGYGLREEATIIILVFGAPALAAAAVIWLMSR